MPNNSTESVPVIRALLLETARTLERMAGEIEALRKERDDLRTKAVAYDHFVHLNSQIMNMHMGWEHSQDLAYEGRQLGAALLGAAEPPAEDPAPEPADGAAQNSKPLAQDATLTPSNGGLDITDSDADLPRSVPRTPAVGGTPGPVQHVNV